MNETTPILVSGRRTPFARAFKGAYKDVRPDDLLCRLLASQIADAPKPDDLLVGCAYPEGEQGYNLARMAALGIGLECPGMTINRLCASSMDAAMVAASRIKSGWGSRFLIGGMESMSRIKRGGFNFSASELIRSQAPTAYVNMGETAEEVARRHPLSRAQQEDFACRSHELASKACDSGLYAGQIFAHLIQRDEFIRFPVDREKMSSLPPAFAPEGVVTAATSSPLTDGATSAWVLSVHEAMRSGHTHGIKLLEVAWSHVAPEVMGLGPIPATRSLLKKRGLSMADLSAIEINEAFAVQTLVCMDQLNMPANIVNCWGGALAIGHPLGASGLRLLMTLHDRLALLNKNGALGLATLCVGGGQGMSVLVEYARLI